MRNWPVQKQTHRRAQKHAEHKDAYIKTVFCVFWIFLFLFFIDD